MEDMETSFTLYGQDLWTVHENDDMSQPLPIRRHRSTIAQLRSDEPVDVLMPLDDSKPHQDDSTLQQQQHEDEPVSSYRLDRRSKRTAFTSSKTRMSAVKKRTKLCFERTTTEASTPLGSRTQVRRNLFDSGYIDDSVTSPAKPLKDIGSAGHTMDTPPAVYHYSSSLQSAATIPSVWKRHSSLQETINRSTAMFAKCHSEAEILSRSPLSGSSYDQNLIGDYSRPCRLPVISGKHPDLKAISHDTMANLLNGGCASVVDEYIVVDCRYPYEYEAGHITGARNIYSKDEIISQFLSSPSLQFLEKKNPILIFHCEFSSERGPKLLRFLRNKDRSVHEENYPELYYPEMYILEGGYKEFCQWHLDLCEPNGYRPMLHKDHSNELAYYRSKSRLYTSKQSQSAANNNKETAMEKHKSFRC